MKKGVIIWTYRFFRISETIKYDCAHRRSRDTRFLGKLLSGVLFRERCQLPLGFHQGTEGYMLCRIILHLRHRDRCKSNIQGLQQPSGLLLSHSWKGLDLWYKIPVYIPGLQCHSHPGFNHGTAFEPDAKSDPKPDEPCCIKSRHSMLIERDPAFDRAKPSFSQRPTHVTTGFNLSLIHI